MGDVLRRKVCINVATRGGCSVRYRSMYSTLEKSSVFDMNGIAFGIWETLADWGSSITSPPCSPVTLPYATGSHHSSYYTFPGEALPHQLDNNSLPAPPHGYPPTLQNTVNGYMRHERMESYNNVYDHHASYSSPACNNNMRGCRAADHMYNYNNNNNDNTSNNNNNNNNNNNSSNNNNTNSNNNNNNGNNNRFPSSLDASSGPRNHNYYNFGHPYYLKQPPEWTLWRETPMDLMRRKPRNLSWSFRTKSLERQWLHLGLMNTRIDAVLMHRENTFWTCRKWI